MGCSTLIIPEVGAGLSAAGAVVSDVGRSFRRLFVADTRSFDVNGVSSKLAELEAEAHAFAKASGVSQDAVEIDFFAEARYAHQVWEIDVAINPNDLRGPNATEALKNAFHEEHERIFAFRDVDSMVEVIAWRAQVKCKIAKSTTLRIAEEEAVAQASRQRMAYFNGWVPVEVHQFSALPVDQELKGPAIVESRFTSVVIDPGASFRRSAEGNLVIQPKAVAQQVQLPMRRAG
jgi:N-methylhydantoinase A